jgi:hypothetical protein
MQQQEKEEAENENENANANKKPNVQIMQYGEHEKLSNETNNDEQTQLLKRRHPVFERKVKVSGNDAFLKQIFS